MTGDPMKCYKCGYEQSDLPLMIPFRAICDKCSAYFHCCRGCRHYQPGRANDCLVPDTDPIADREACNYCEEFAPGPNIQPTSSADDAARRLFGDDVQAPKSKSFDDLFG